MNLSKPEGRAGSSNQLGSHYTVNILIILSDLNIEDSLIKLFSQLQTLTCNTTYINNFKDALSHIISSNFDICIIGPNLTAEKCPEFIAKLKSKDPSLPIIIIVGDSPTPNDIEAIHAGACDYLVKSSVNSHQLELSIRYGINRRKREQRLLWTVEAQKTIKDVAVDLASFNAFEETPALDSCLERVTKLFDANAIILLIAGKLKILWSTDAKILAAIQCDNQATKKIEETWQPLLSALVGKVSICSDSSPKIKLDLEQNSAWATLCAQNSWCASDSVANMGSSAILVLFSSQNFLNSDSDRIRAINELCNVFRASFTRIDSELALEKSKSQYRNLVENLSESILLCDMEENIVQVNSRLEELLGYSSESLLGRKSYEVLLPHGEYNQIIARINNRHQGISEKYEINVLRANGSRVWCEVQASPVYDESGRLIGSMGALSDISSKVLAIEQSHRLQRELLQSQKFEAVGETAAGIASEISSALGVITGHLQLLDLPNQRPEQRKNSAKAAIDQCNSAQLILKRLYDLSQPSKGYPIVASPSSLVTKSINFLKSFLGPDTEIEHLSLRDELRIEIDPLQFRQILMSTILSIKSPSSTNGIVQISHGMRSIALNTTNFSSIDPSDNSEIATRYAVIIVDNPNSGVSADHLRRLLLPRLGEGIQIRDTSIELATLSSLMLSVGGLLDISPLPIKGTRIELSFPEFTSELQMVENKDNTIDMAEGQDINSEDTHHNSTIEKNQASKKPAANKVLVVDDEEMLVQLMQRFLELSGIESYGYSNPELALSWFKENYQEIGLVVLDLKMSRMDGRECFAKMLEIDPNVRVGFLSGFIEPEVEQGLLRQGALRFFQKPLRYPELVEWVKFALQPKS